MIKIYDNVKNEILNCRTFKKSKELAKNGCKNYKHSIIILGKDTITIAEVVL